MSRIAEDETSISVTLSFAITLSVMLTIESAATYNHEDDALEAVDEGEEYGQVAWHRHSWTRARSFSLGEKEFLGEEESLQC